MSYQNKPLPKAYYTGDDFIPVSCEKELLSIREEIENGESHKGRNFEICYQAMKDIHYALGHNQPKADCQNCVQTWNKILNNWFKKYDNKPMPRHSAVQTTPKPLIPLSAKEGAELLKSGKETKVIVDGKEYTKEDLNDTWVPLGESVESNVSKTEVELLREECDAKGIEYRWNAGVKKLTELLGR